MTPCANDNWVRRFTVSDPRKHNNGFTIYKVTSIVFPKGSPEASTKVIVWKRYNDFKKLHSELHQKHKKLYLQGKFPAFAEAKFFRRFEEEVIEERRKCATVLLEFIGAHPPLFTSNAFVKFFESGYDQNECKEFGQCSEEWQTGTGTQDTLAYAQNGALHPVSSPIEQSHTKSMENGSLLKLGGTWQYPQVSDSISLSSHSSSEHTSFTDTDSIVSGPNAPPQKEGSQALNQNNGKEADHPSNWVPTTATQASSTPPDVPMEDPKDYMVQANHHVTQAMRHQAAGAYDAAFSLLKLAISCLLTGVQDETDGVRRYTVKRKASEYLATAEKLYNEHLAPRFPSPSQPAPRSQPVACPLSSLQAFKVLGVVGKVMLAMSTEEDQCYIVKVLYKSPCPVNRCQVPILPLNVPYMVKLHFYFETESTVFLFLQHASGGRLWDHIISYLQSQPATPVHLLSRGNVYLGRKLIEESSSATINDAPGDNDTLFAAQDDSYAALIENYREGKLRIEFQDDSANNDQCHSNSENSTQQLNVDAKTNHSPTVEEILKNCPDVPVSDSLNLQVSSKHIGISSLVSDCLTRNVEHLETKELMRNAQQLLQSVSETLLKSSIGDNESLHGISESETLEPEDRTPVRTKPRLKGLPLRRRSSGTRLPLEHRLSSDDLVEWRTACGGGSMHHWEKPAPRLPEGRVREWAEQLVTCLAALHESGLVFRDLHPDNILLAEGGHVLLSFTCSWPAVDTVVNREAVENLYAAPEVTSIFEATPAADWWSLGALLFELITGKPLHLSQPGGVHSHSILSFPDFVSAEAQSLLTELLRYHPQERLGTGVGGVEEIKSHPFFTCTDWSAVHMAGLKK